METFLYNVRRHLEAAELQRWMRAIFGASILALLFLSSSGLAQSTQPLVAVHDSELTRALETMPAAGATPTGPGTTGFQWWPTDWHYFVMPEAVKETLRSDGTPFTVVGDSNITAGLLLTNGQPRFPILISLASEAIRDDEIGPLTNYVAAGGFLFVGSSAFTRNTDGTARGDFALASQLGIHQSSSSLANWNQNNTFNKQVEHRLTAHFPNGSLTNRLPGSSEEICWGVSPSHPFLAPHDVWRVQAAGATVLGTGDSSPYLLIRPYGKGYFIYCAAFQPLIGHGGFAPGMYSYVVFRKAIEWAFESLSAPVPRLSPWPYPYDAAMMVRHDLENFTNEIAALEASAQVEFTNGAKGDYYFCTGTLRDDASPTYNTNSIVASLRRAVTNYGATIGPHNGGLKNPGNAALVRGQYDYWHWGPDEVLDLTPAGFASGKAYASASLSNSFRDVESWLTGITNGVRGWVACYFNATRDDSYDLQAQLGVRIVGDQKLSPFPHWTFSTRTPGLRYPLLSEPVSDWFVGGLVAQSLEPWHPPGVHTSQTLHEAIDFYYNLGALVNIYSHTLSTGLGDAGQLVPDYITYCVNTNAHPRMWNANGLGVYKWWLQRSNAQVTASFSTNGSQTIATLSIKGATDTNTTVEVLLPGTNSFCGFQVFTNGTLATGNSYRINGQTVKVRVGATVSNAIVTYAQVGPAAQVFSQNFDAVTAPALPAGWTTSASGVQSNWVTQTSVRDTTPNSAFVPDPGNIGLSELISPAIALPAGSAQLTFRNNYDLETGAGTDGFDGGVLEIKIGASAFSDILAAGGTFASGGYNSTIDTAYSNPLAGRQAWSGTSAGFVTTSVNLPPSAGGQTIQFRWRCGTDDSNGRTGWRIDTITLTNRACLCCSASNSPPVLQAQANRTLPAQTILVVTNTATDLDLPPQMLFYQLLSPPAGASIDSSGIITWVPAAGPSTNALTTAVTDNGTPPLSATNSFSVVVTAIPTNTPPAITAQPTSRTNNAGSTATFTVIATGSSLAYQWYQGATLLPSATGSVLSLNGVSDGDAGGYNVIITNGFGSVTSSIATLTIIDPPLITTQPVSRTNIAGTTATFNGTASGTSPSLQWVKNGNNLVSGGNVSGATTATLNLASVTAADAANYALVANNQAGSATSVVAALTVIVPPGIITQPVSQTSYPGSNITFTVVASGSPPTYQWFKNTTNALLNTSKFSGATSAALTVANVSISDTGSYSVVLSNAAGAITSAPAILALADTNTPPVLFSDNFTRGTDPGPLTPWLAQDGTWTVTGGALRAGTNALATYAFAYMTNSWTNYSVQARVRFSANSAYGGGLGGRLNVNSGGHYAAWIYPENSPAGPALEIVRFQDWLGYEYTNTSGQVIQRVSLPAVGTNWHTLKLGFQGNQISVYYDSNLVASATDAESNPYLSGGISVDMWTDTIRYSMFVDDVLVNPLPTVLMALNDSYTVGQGASVTVPAPGVLANDTAGAQPNLTAVRISGPSRGTLTLNPNGSFTYQPSNNVVGVDSFTYVANDGITNSRPATVAIDVAPSTNIFFDNFARSANSNSLAPWVIGIGEWAVTNGVLLGNSTTRNNYSDAYVPGNWSDFSIQARFQLPATAWACGLSGRVDPITGARYVANVYPENSPLGPGRSLRIIKFHQWENWSLTPMALVSLPAVGTSFHTLKMSFQGNQITVFFDGAQVASVTDSNFDGVPAFTSGAFGAHMYMDSFYQATFDDVSVVSLAATNHAPVLSAPPNQTIAALTTLTVSNTGTDQDVPAQALTYQLLSPPAGASISAAGVITWMPSAAQAPSTNVLTTVVTDNGSPTRSATNSFTVTVTPANQPPVLPAQANQTIAELNLLQVANAATDPDGPANGLSYTLLNPPAGAAISSGGLISWTPTEAQGPGTNTVTTRVTDSGNPPLSATNSFAVVVTEINSPPVLPAQSDRTIAELTTLNVANTATDSDLPANILSYSLLTAPAGASISSGGVITWTPTEAQGPGTNLFTTRVADNGTPSLSATNTFTVVVSEVNSAPVLPVQTNRSVIELSTLVVTNSATDPDIPTNTLTYVLLNPPSGAAIDASGVISWTPSATQGPGTNVITTVASDDGTPPLSATNSFTVFVVDTNTPPVITGQPSSRTNNAATTATFTVGANGSSLNYQWYHGASALVAATAATLSLSSVSDSDAGGYNVVITNLYGSATSTVATLTIIDPPIINGQPASRTNNAGTTATFTVTVSGTTPTLQWVKNGTNNLTNGGNISGATSLTLTLSGVTAADAANYTLVATNAAGSATSSVAILTVLVPPSIVTQPASQTNYPGSNTVFTVVAAGTSPSYQWRKNATNVLLNVGNISGATTPSLTVSNIAAVDAGSYTVVITNIAGSLTSAPAILALVNTNAPASLFSDDFTRGTDPGPLTPWLSQAGVWTVTGGLLRAGTNTLRTYGDLYVTNSWTNYSVQGQIRFPVGAYGGGLGACLNRANGAHYSAWVYPERSAGGSNVLKLIKFQTWTTWGYRGTSFSPMTQVNLASVGTNWHALQLNCSSNQITVSYDGAQVINITDTEATPYLSGGISVDLWTDVTGYSMFVDNVVVNSLSGGTQPLARVQQIVVSPPFIQSVALSDGAAVVTWRANPGTVYRLQFNDSLNPNDWKDDGADIVATEETVTATNQTGSATQRFYRIRVVP